MRIVNFSEARQNLNKIIETTVDDAEITVIKRRDKQDAVLMSYEDYCSMEETLYLLQSPKNAEHLLSAMKDVEEGLVEEHDLEP